MEEGRGEKSTAKRGMLKHTFGTFICFDTQTHPTWVETQTHERVRANVLDHSLLAREEQCERTQPTPTALIRQDYNKGSKYKCEGVKVERRCRHALSRHNMLKVSHIYDRTTEIRNK